MQDNHVRILPKKLEECINSNFVEQYEYNQEENTITVLKNPHTIKVSPKNGYYMKEFLKDICGIMEIGKLI